MSIYYNSVGEGWFKKKDNVVNEAKYTANDLACTDNLKLMKYEGHRNILEIDLDTMDWDSKEVTDFLLKYLKSKNADFYACQDIIDTTIQGAKRDGSDTVYIAFESKEETVNEENNNYIELGNKYLKELNNILNDFPIQTLKNAIKSYLDILKINKIESENDLDKLIDKVLTIQEIWAYERSQKMYKNMMKLDDKYNIEEFVEKSFK